MRQFKIVFLFELKRFISAKSYWIITGILMLLLIVSISFPRMRGFFEELFNTSSDITDRETQTSILLVNGTEGLLSKKQRKVLQYVWGRTFPESRVELIDGSEDMCRHEVNSGNADCAFFFINTSSYTYYVKTLEMTDRRTSRADEALKKYQVMIVLQDADVKEEAIDEIVETEITHVTINLGTDQQKNFFYAYIMVMILYMVIIYYGQSIMTGVAFEKSSKAMELLVTSVDPTSMIFGKILAASASSLLQISLTACSAVLSYRLNGNLWREGSLVNTVMNMPGWIFRYMLLFFLLGFILYAFLYGAAGSTVTKMEETGQASLPITTILIAGLFVSLFSMTENSMDSLLFRACSYFPFTSPMVMFSRIAMSEVSEYQIAVSVAILIVSVILIGIISAKIYRAGVLVYGKRLTIRTMLTAVFFSK